MKKSLVQKFNNYFLCFDLKLKYSFIYFYDKNKTLMFSVLPIKTIHQSSNETLDDMLKCCKGRFIVSYKAEKKLKNLYTNDY